MSDLKRYQREDSGNLGESYDFLKGRVGQAKKAIRRGPGGVVERILEYYRSGLGKLGGGGNVGQGVGGPPVGVSVGVTHNPALGEMVGGKPYGGANQEGVDVLVEEWARMSEEERAQYGGLGAFLESRGM